MPNTSAIRKEIAMKISDVLADKGYRVETVEATTPLDTIIRRFSKMNISSAVIVDAAHRPKGIITDRIVIDAIAELGPDAMRLSVDEVMQSPAPHCAPEDNLSFAMRVMTNKRTRHLIVQTDGAMLGIVSIGDLVHFRIRDAELESNVLRDMASACRISA